MLKHIKSESTNSYGFIISIPNTELVSDCPAGITHFGEHMLFCGTKSFDSDQLRKKHAELFAYLEATTSRDQVNIFGYFHKRHFAEAVHVLREMIFDWKCRPADFEAEKRDAIAEAEHYYQTNDYRRRKAAYHCLPIRNYEPVGDLQWLKDLSKNDLKDIKKHWQEMISSGMDILMIGDELNAAKKKALSVFDSTRSAVKHKDSERQIIDKKEIKGWYLDSGTYLLDSLVLDRIYRKRWQTQGEYMSEYESMNVGGIMMFYVFKDGGLSAKYADRIFKPKISATEFTAAKRSLLDHFDMIDDRTDLISTLIWYGGFLLGNYCLPKELREINDVYKYFEKLRLGTMLRNTKL